MLRSSTPALLRDYSGFFPRKSGLSLDGGFLLWRKCGEAVMWCHLMNAAHAKELTVEDGEGLALLYSLCLISLL